MNAPTETVIPEVIRAEAVITPEASLALRAGHGAVELAEQWNVDCAEMAEVVTQEVVTVEGRAKALDAARKSITDPLRKALENANGIFMPVIKELEAASTVMRGKLLTWKRAEDARIEAERRAAEEIARKARQEAEAKAASERAAAEAVAVEERRKAEEARKAQEIAAAAGKAEEAMKAAAEAAAAQERANAAIENGQAKAEAAIIEAAATMPVAPVAPPMPKGTGSREKWEARLEDKPDALHRLVKYIAANPQFLGLLKIDQSAANKLAGSLKSALKIDGLIVEDVGTLTIRKRA